MVMGLASLALKRLRYHPGLSLLALLGVILAVGLVTSASFFAQAVDQVIMRRELAEYSRITKRPPFAARVYTFSSPQNPLPLERARQLGQHVAGTLSGELGLPVKYLDLQMRTPVMKLLAQPGSEKYQGNRPLGDVHLLYMEGIEDHIDVVTGEPLAEGVSGDALEVWMHTALAEKMGVQIGETFDLYGSGDNPPLPIQLKGFWQAKDAADPFWFNDPDTTLRPMLLVRRQDYLTYVEPWLPVQGRSATWHIVFDEDKAVPAEGRRYVTGFERGQVIINKYLPDARLTAPSLSLEKFVQRQTTLTILLLGFNVPAFGFLLYFLVLTSVVIAYWQRRETAVMVSRGMSISSVLNFTFIEELVLFVIGCPLGLGFGVLLARLMGDTVSFLSFASRPPLPISWRGISISLTLITLGVVLIARLWPAAVAARQSVVQQEREHARPLRPPFWYRNYLDFLLIIPTAYAYRQLADRGTLALLVRDRPEDLYQDPLLILVPALFILTLALLAMRIFPLLMRLLDKLASLTPWTTAYLALRQLGRQGHSYINPLLLVIVSLALGIYTLSMAASLDQWLVDRMYYRAGTDLTFEPFLKSEFLSEVPTIGAEWIPPQDEFETLPGVVAAARVGDYQSEIALAGGEKIRGRFLAVDRVEFSQVAWFRGDFARESLGSLMNRLATSPDSILVSQAFLEENHLQIGDKISIKVLVDFGASVNSSFTVAGTYHYFPTVYEDEVTVIGNLEHLFSFFGLTMPHNIWLRTQDGADGQAILQAVTSTGIETIEEKDARALITEEQAKMERVGVFGTLSISFMAAAVMAAMGLLTYSYASLQERLYHFAMLRAMGLRRRQVVGQVFLEYAILTAYGSAAGVFIGSWTAEFFVPLFRVTGERGIPLPPLLPVIAQEEIIPLAVVFAGIMILLELIVIGSALYRRLFGMLRLGHQG
jgi:putative ABC transport system permease protein